jgi:hypothetical protein
VTTKRFSTIAPRIPMPMLVPVFFYYFLGSLLSEKNGRMSVAQFRKHLPKRPVQLALFLGGNYLRTIFVCGFLRFYPIKLQVIITLGNYISYSLKDFKILFGLFC